jgi:membrane protein required for colicin V production
MNGVDIAILVILAAFVVKGLVRGLLKELCSLLGLFGGMYLALRFHPYLAEGLLKTFDLPAQLGVVIAFAAVFMLTVLLFALLGFLLSRFVKLLFLGGFNRVAGGLFGLMQGGVLVVLVLFGLMHSPLPKEVQGWLRKSQLAPPLVQMGETLFRQGRQMTVKHSPVAQAPGHRQADS